MITLHSCLPKVTTTSLLIKGCLEMRHGSETIPPGVPDIWEVQSAGNGSSQDWGSRSERDPDCNLRSGTGEIRPSAQGVRGTGAGMRRAGEKRMGPEEQERLGPGTTEWERLGFEVKCSCFRHPSVTG